MPEGRTDPPIPNSRTHGVQGNEARPGDQTLAEQSGYCRLEQGRGIVLVDCGPSNPVPSATCRTKAAFLLPNGRQSARPAQSKTVTEVNRLNQSVDWSAFVDPTGSSRTRPVGFFFSEHH